ncbi:MAG: hypothetical protein OEV73_11795 [Desulfobulbaceae bacterium]|nr:hypothetical protein [Desulfobulbaceae bacterium]
MMLARREKILVGVAGGLAALYLVLQLLVFPFLDKVDGLRGGVRAKEAALREMLVLRDEYHASRQGYLEVERLLEKRGKDFTLFTFLEAAADAAAIKANIKYMKPSESGAEGLRREALVEMKLEKVTLAQLVTFLRGVESPQHLVTVRRITVQESKGQQDHLDIILQVATFE